jgi:prevent-host-death family protein
MKIASVADVKTHFSSYVRDRRGGPVVVTRNGKPVAVLLAVEDDDDLERVLLAQSPRFQAILEAGKKQIRDGLGIPEDEFWRQVEEENRHEEEKKLEKPAQQSQHPRGSGRRRPARSSGR